MSWAILHVTDNVLDGHREWLEGTTITPGCPTLLFSSRQAARLYTEEAHGYIRKRPDLQAEPHGWKMPRPVKVSIRIERD